MEVKLIELLGGLILKLAGLNAMRKKEVAAYLEYIAELTAKFAPRFRDSAPFDELHGYTRETERIAKQFVSATSDVLKKKELEEFQSLLDQAVNAKNLLERSPKVGKDTLLAELAEVAAAFRASSATLKGKASRVG